MNILYNLLNKHHPLSGISHHMFFDTDIINELIKLVEEYHFNKNNIKKLFWKIFLELVDINHYNGSGASEYEIYFNYMYLYHKNDIVIRQLNWKNLSDLDTNNTNNNDFVSIHWYLRKK